MPLQSRVLPSEDIVADPARKMFTGIRSCLDVGQRQLDPARWKGKALICCALKD